MRIADKISFLVLFLLAVLTFNSFLGLTHISKIEAELQKVVRQDMALTSVVTAVTQFQLEKTVLIEKALRVAEEMDFDDIPPARRQHLLDFAELTREGYEDIIQQEGEQIISGKELLLEAQDQATSQDKRERFGQALEILKDVERISIYYDQLVVGIFERIGSADYQLDFSDLRDIRQGENDLTRKLKDLLAAVQLFTRQSLSRAQDYHLLTRENIWFTLLVSIVLGAAVAYWIVRGISVPLKGLAVAAGQIGAGDFRVHVANVKKDEIGEVSQAMNAMAARLEEFRAELEKKNRILAKHLLITRAQKKELQAINREMDRFVYTVSHDIGAPLRGILWYGNYLKKNFLEQFDKKGQECLTGICRSADHLNLMIEDLLTLTRISRIKNPYEETSSLQIVESVIQRLELVIKKNNVVLNISDALPVLVCDRIKLAEVLYNLLSNAIKFSSKENSQRPTVEIGYQDRGEAHEFYVRDNGIGIDPVSHGEVFDVFTRLHTNREYEGTGTGLSIVKTVVKDHGGDVWIVSQLGEGAAFHFSIPKNLSNKS